MLLINRYFYSKNIEFISLQVQGLSRFLFVTSFLYTIYGVMLFNVGLCVDYKMSVCGGLGVGGLVGPVDGQRP